MSLRRKVIRASCVVSLAVATSAVTPGLAHAATCTPSSESYLGADVRVVEIASSDWHGNFTDLNDDTISLSTKKGTSATITTERSVGVTASAHEVNASITHTTASEATVTVEQDVSHEFRVPANTRMKVVYAAAVGVSTQGWTNTQADCSTERTVDRQDAEVVETGYVVHQEHPDGTVTVSYPWAPTTYTAVPTF